MNKIPNYRVWHKIEKRFVDLRNIDFEQDSIGYDCQGEANYYDVAKFDEIVFQQFTGLKDSKCVDIYEGDIVSYELDGIVYTQTVGWGNNGWEMIDTRLYSTPLITNLPNFEVIGNIFENSELLNNELEKN
jgi:uncharacterized phage protein (TIGR01671 family)